MGQSCEIIFENNRKWLEQKEQQYPDYFKELADGQNSEYLYIGCSDSRVAAEGTMGLEPGEVFVHRNVANLVHGPDLNAAPVIEYAVSHLKVKHIIIRGHYNYGGIKATMKPQGLGSMNSWLHGIRDVYRLHQEELDAIEDGHLCYDRLVELNVQEQCLNVIKMACVQERYLFDGYPIVHGWVLDLRTGRLIDLSIDFKNILVDIQKVYDLADSGRMVNACKKAG